MITKNNIDDFESIYFTGTTEKDAFDYQVGEEMVFHISLLADGHRESCPMLKYTVVNDDGTKAEGQCDGSDGCIEIRTRLTVPGYSRVTVDAVDQEGNILQGISRYAGGACAGFELITATEAEPADFDAFWAMQMRELDTVSPTASVCRQIPSGENGFQSWDVQICCWDNPYVSGILTIPENAASGSLGLLLSYPGSGIFSASPVCRAGYATFSVNANPIPNCLDDYSEYEKSIGYYGFSNDENQNRDTVYFRRMIIRDVQALRYMKTLAEWNTKEIVLEGGSQGGALVLQTAALCPEVTRVYAWAPWLCDLSGYTIGRLRGEVTDYFQPLAYYDTVFFAKRIRCETEITGGLGDDICTPAGVTAAYNALRCRKTIILTQNRTHCYYPPDPHGYRRSEDAQC